MNDAPESAPETMPVDAGEGVENTSTPEAPESSNAEAAKYRVRLREAEAERDQLAVRLADAQRQNANHQVAQRFADPGDFWSATKLDDLLGEDGRVDGDKLGAAMDAALEAKPHWRKPASVTESVSTVRSREHVGAGKPEPTFADAFRPPEARNR